jgi:hypothetical protein
MMQGTKEEMGSTVNGEVDGSIPSLAAKEEWNEEQGILALEEFKVQLPDAVSIGIVASRDPEKRATLKRIFLDVLRTTGQVTEACRICNVPKSLAFKWRYDDPEFMTRWDMITRAELLPHLESEAFRRAMNGSDLLMMFLMKAYDRDRFDDRAAQTKVLQKQPSITIQIRDVDRSLVAIADSSKNLPSIEYQTGRLLDAKKEQSTVIDAEYGQSDGSDNGPIARTTEISKK